MSPRAAKQPVKPEPNTIYVAWQAFCTDAMPGAPVIPNGSRLRGDNPAVLACPHNFVKHGASRDEVGNAALAHSAASPSPEPVADFRAPPAPLRDADACVAIRRVSALDGSDRSGTGYLEQAPLVGRARAAPTQRPPRCGAEPFGLRAGCTTRSDRDHHRREDVQQ